MDFRHPVQTLEWALTQALERDLGGVESALANDLITASAPISCRPRATQCQVVLFSQSWRGSDLGFERGVDAGEHVEAETVIVTGPAGDACVYVSTQLLYRIERPNRRFFLDVAAQQLRGKGESARYEGRDSADEEAFDFEVAGALARLREAVRHGEPGDGERVARVLGQVAEEIRNEDTGINGCRPPLEAAAPAQMWGRA